MRLSMLALSVLLLPFGSLHAQWQLQDAHTTADLRGIHNLGGGVAWASGTNGTVLRTEDAGFVWQLCAVPPGAEHLDFRGIQAFDNNTAIVMSSGKGDLSRLYETTDGCQSWTLLFTNPDKDGFWDGLVFRSTIPPAAATGFLLGDPVDGQYRLFERDGPNDRWTRLKQQGLQADANAQGAFAASNSALQEGDGVGEFLLFGTGGTAGAFLYRNVAMQGCPEPHCGGPEPQTRVWHRCKVPVGSHSASSGVFSLGARPSRSKAEAQHGVIVAVGGDYLQPNTPAQTAASSFDRGSTWSPAHTPPHGYRSAVAYDPIHQTWITVGPNGTDISTDDGRNWRPLKPGPNDPPDADQHWNALSLPYVVGPHGRIATLRPDALPISSKNDRRSPSASHP